MQKYEDNEFMKKKSFLNRNGNGRETCYYNSGYYGENSENKRNVFCSQDSFYQLMKYNFFVLWNDSERETLKYNSCYYEEKKEEKRKIACSLNPSTA